MRLKRWMWWAAGAVAVYWLLGASSSPSPMPPNAFVGPPAPGTGGPNGPFVL